MEEKTISKTTITFRLAPDVKLKLIQEAESEGLTLSQYIENKVSGGVPRTPTLDKGVPLDDQHVHIAKEAIDFLKYLHPTCSDSEIVTACLVHAKENMFALWQRSLATYLRRLSNGKYSKPKNPKR